MISFRTCLSKNCFASSAQATLRCRSCEWNRVRNALIGGGCPRSAIGPSEIEFVARRRCLDRRQRESSDLANSLAEIRRRDKQRLAQEECRPLALFGLVSYEFPGETVRRRCGNNRSAPIECRLNRSSEDPAFKGEQTRQHKQIVKILPSGCLHGQARRSPEASRRRRFPWDRLSVAAPWMKAAAGIPIPVPRA